VAYGARLESVLGESPRGFESPILRHGNSPVALVFTGLCVSTVIGCVLFGVLNILRPIFKVNNSLALNSRSHVRIGVKCGPNVRVAESLLNNFC
jgi:hypothetical protein